LGRFGFDTVPLEASLGQEECFEYLLITYRVSLIEAFRQLHPDLFTPAYWQRVQRLLRQGEILDTFPYPPHKRLQHRRASAAGRARLVLPTAVEAEMERLGLKSAHRRGLIAWQSLRSALAVGRVSVDALDTTQKAAVQQSFGIAEGLAAPTRLGVIVVDGVPAFAYVTDLSTAVVDLSEHYAVEREVADEWRERVQREVFGQQRIEFCRPA